ncbi:MAG: hypothetical protein IK052_02825 [Bacteroidales bacterium]|nr:hypothetical protein [Bacteroidales bacterium]
MKKILMTLAAALCCALMFTACQKPADNDDTKQEEQPQEEATTLDDLAAQIAKVVVEYQFLTTEDLLGFFNFNLEYLDVTTGNKITEKISATEFKKVFDNAALPLDMGYNLTTTLKEGKTIDDVKAASSVSYITPEPSVWISMYDKDNKLIGDGGHRFNAIGHVTMSGEKLAKRFTDGNFNKSYFESVNEKGSGQKGSWK